MKSMQSFVDAQDRIIAFCRLVLDHLRTLSQQGNLSENGLGKALLDFAALPGITEENVLSEIMIMFIAGIIRFLLWMFSCTHTLF